MENTMTNKDKLYSQVWTKPYYDNEMGDVPAINWGQVVRYTPKSIWIQGPHLIEKWTVQTDGNWKNQYNNIKRKFSFKLDPLVKFVLSK